MKNKKIDNRILCLIIAALSICICILLFIILKLNICNNDKKIYSLDEIMKSVVSIKSYSGININKTGSGFIYKIVDEEAYIITNNHVIENSTELNVYTSAENYVKARVVGFSRYLDIAVIAIKNNKYKPLPLNKKNNISTGDNIYTVGTPLSNEFYNSVSSGIISYASRLRMENNSNIDTLMNMIQMNIIINPGNSGGPVLNEKLEVIGVCTSSITSDKTDGISFAVPISSILNKLDEIEIGEVKTPRIGNIKIADINDSEILYTSDLIEKFTDNEGVIILNDDKESGLKKGDIIIMINKMVIKDKKYFEYYINQFSKGETINLIIIRNNNRKKIRIKLQ